MAGKGRHQNPSPKPAKRLRVRPRMKNRTLKARHTFQVIIEQDEAGYFVAECPALKACYTQGKTYEEVLENIRDVITLCLRDLKERGEEVPRQPEIIAIKRVEVAA
jgi:predicted RNase H-like HicB family nuclease